MSNILNNLPEIIEYSSKEPLGIISLIIISVAIVTYFLLKNSNNELTRVILYIIFVGTMVFIFININTYIQANSEMQKKQKIVEKEISNINKEIEKINNQKLSSKNNEDILNKIKSLEKEKDELQKELKNITLTQQIPKTEEIKLLEKEKDELLKKSKNIVLAQQMNYKISKIKNIDVAIVIGHKESSPGAKNQKSGVSEFLFNENLALDINNLLQKANISSKVIYRKTYSTLPNDINQYSPKLVISLHANAFDGFQSGSQVIFKDGSEEGKKLAELMLYSISRVLDLENRKIKPVSEQDRGGYLIYNTKALTLIIDPFFIDNDQDLKIAIEKRKTLALAIKNVIKDYIDTKN